MVMPLGHYHPWVFQSYSKGYSLFLPFAAACNISLSFTKMAEASSGGFLTMEMDSVGHVDAQSPQPMHLSLSMTVRSFSNWMALTWHRSTQVPQVVQVSWSFMA